MIKWERKCKCGKMFQTNEEETAKGLGRYCGEKCLQKASKEKGELGDYIDYADGTHLYQISMDYYHPINTPMQFQHLNYAFFGERDDGYVDRLVWQGAWDGKSFCEHEMELRRPLSFDQLVLLLNRVFKGSPENLFRALVIAGPSDFDFESYKRLLLSVSHPTILSQ